MSKFKNTTDYSILPSVIPMSATICCQNCKEPIVCRGCSKESAEAQATREFLDYMTNYKFSHLIQATIDNNQVHKTDQISPELKGIASNKRENAQKVAFEELEKKLQQKWNEPLQQIKNLMAEVEDLKHNW